MDFTFVVSYGRSGSTLLMKMLSQHPSFAIRPIFPYETRTAQYLYAAAKEGVWTEVDDASFQQHSYHIAQHGDREMRQLVRSAVISPSHPREAAATIYRKVCRAAGKPHAQFITEKSIGITMAKAFLDHHPSETRSIFLFRDPRSIYFSVKSFNERRGNQSFGSECGEAVLFDRIISFLTIMRKVQSAAPGKTIPVQYEALVTAPEKTLASILSLHGLAKDDDTIARMICAMHDKDSHTEKHATVTLRDSLDRWKTDASSTDLAIFSKHSERLAMLSY